MARFRFFVWDQDGKKIPAQPLKATRNDLETTLVEPVWQTNWTTDYITKSGFAIYVDEETKAMVLENICFLLNSFLRCTVYEHVIFCWVMHQQEIIDTILAKLNTENCRVHCVSLICSPEVLEKRLRGDIAKGIRTPEDPGEEPVLFAVVRGAAYGKDRHIRAFRAAGGGPDWPATGGGMNDAFKTGKRLE